MKKLKIKVPHVYALLFGVMILVALLTYIVPAGEFERVTDESTGRTIIEGDTFNKIEQSPVGPFSLFQSIHRGMLNTAGIIFYIFIVGGAFGVLHRTGAIGAVVGEIASKMKGRELFLIPILMTFFALGGAMLGLAEETIPYITILVPLVVIIGYDSIVAAAIVLVGSSVGFTTSFMNPFTVGVAQGIAEVDLFSGMGLRIISWFIFLVVSIIYVMNYAKKIKKDPTKSLMYGVTETEDLKITEIPKLELKHKLVFLVLVITILTLAFGVIRFSWELGQISALFIIMAITMGLLAKMKADEIAEGFVEGCQSIVLGALVVGLANAILVILQDGKIMDTILYSFSNSIEGLPSSFSAVGMFFVQSIMNFIVPSGSGQAALTMPIMAPLADLVNVTRQTAVLAFQFGDGISNVFTPTSGYFMAGLALAKIPWIRWVKWIFPLIIIHYCLGAIIVTVAHLIGYS